MIRPRRPSTLMANKEGAHSEIESGPGMFVSEHLAS